MNLTFRTHFGDLTMNDCCRSRRPSIQMMYFGVTYALEVKGGKRSETRYVEFNKGEK
jgi:hypothetical protein